MDKNVEWVIEKKLQRTIENLEKNNMGAYFVKDENSLLEKISELINEGDTVSVGGSMSLFETGVIDMLRSGKYNFLDRYKPNLTKEDIKEIYRKSFYADAYFTSSNAVTEDGELYNVDGTGNRVAAMIYGPDKVIVVIGLNKIVKNLDEAIERNRRCAAPANAKRLDRKTPCAKLGYCVDCNSPERICNDYVLIRKQGQKGRINVIIVGKELGY
ncbi:lactate utilization protein [Clostridium ganghwense]|uniref:Lactate utilization protein n=1 Tax=Clostridium ganghwense TaxID=312089 RepID=A0ABT4CTE2_9CLOT|nr:lactate utilization protein [Clostridium ganghwense]MCY6371311.1 lactate utilization protein [Clostridium ganghwense]